MNGAERTITVKPWRVGPYSRAMTVPGWWLRLNDFPDELEVTFSMGQIIIRPKVVRESKNGQTRSADKQQKLRP